MDRSDYYVDRGLQNNKGDTYYRGLGGLGSMTDQHYDRADRYTNSMPQGFTQGIDRNKVDRYNPRVSKYGGDHHEGSHVSNSYGFARDTGLGHNNHVHSSEREHSRNLQQSEMYHPHQERSYQQISGDNGQGYHHVVHSQHSNYHLGGTHAPVVVRRSVHSRSRSIHRIEPESHVTVIRTSNTHGGYIPSRDQYTSSNYDSGINRVPGSHHGSVISRERIISTGSGRNLGDNGARYGEHVIRTSNHGSALGHERYGTSDRQHVPMEHIYGSTQNYNNDPSIMRR